MEKHINPSEEAGKKFFMEYNTGEKVVMLNLLKFRPKAEYPESSSIAPEQEISGEAAYNLYIDSTIDELTAVGSKILFFGSSNSFLIGPDFEQWDAVLLVEHASVKKFMGFAKSDSYLKYMEHRTAALEDSRLLPIKENKSYLY